MSKFTQQYKLLSNNNIIKSLNNRLKIKLDLKQKNLLIQNKDLIALSSVNNYNYLNKTYDKKPKSHIINNTNIKQLNILNKKNILNIIKIHNFNKFKNFNHYNNSAGLQYLYKSYTLKKIQQYIINYRNLIKKFNKARKEVKLILKKSLFRNIKKKKIKSRIIYKVNSLYNKIKDKILYLIFDQKKRSHFYKNIYKKNNLTYLSRLNKLSKYYSLSIYHLPIINKFINNLMKNGKKSLAEKIFYKTITYFNKKNKKPLLIFKKAMVNSKPLIELKPFRQKGRTLQMPRAINNFRQSFLAMKWIVEASKESHKLMSSNSLADELMNSAKNKGKPQAKIKNLYKAAKENLVFLKVKHRRKKKKDVNNDFDNDNTYLNKLKLPKSRYLKRKYGKPYIEPKLLVNVPEFVQKEYFSDFKKFEKKRKLKTIINTSLTNKYQRDLQSINSSKKKYQLIKLRTNNLDHKSLTQLRINLKKNKLKHDNVKNNLTFTKQ